MRATRLDNEIRRVLRLERHLRLANDQAVDAALAMDMMGVRRRDDNRILATLEYCHVPAPDQFAKQASVSAGQRKRSIPRNGGDAQYIEALRGCKSQEKIERVILSGIAIDDDFCPAHAPAPTNDQQGRQRNQWRLTIERIAI